MKQDLMPEFSRPSPQIFTPEFLSYSKGVGVIAIRLQPRIEVFRVLDVLF